MNAAHLSPPWLTDAEIVEMCAPLEQPAAQCRHLESLGLLVRRKPNGRPLLMRSELDRVLGATRITVQAAAPAPSMTTPNVTALRDHLSKKKHGATA
ncbi:DUF4224 domain-containing protein [Acidovorax sp. LjRoot129]|uniref:hypothetical protein n=1 Tax=Acidovorax sp. LjRoot129 TaxID=3342260 RepID=UPI003ECE25F3